MIVDIDRELDEQSIVFNGDSEAPKSAHWVRSGRNLNAQYVYPLVHPSIRIRRLCVSSLRIYVTWFTKGELYYLHRFLPTIRVCSTRSIKRRLIRRIDNDNPSIYDDVVPRTLR